MPLSGPMGADSHNRYARRKTGREPVEPLHPELAEARRRIAPRWWRSLCS